MSAGLTTTTDEVAALDTFSALQAMLGEMRFWSPDGIGQAPLELQDSYLDRVIGRTPKQRERLEALRSIRVESPFVRAYAAQHILKGATRELRRGFAWAAGLPLEMVERYNPRNGLTLNLTKSGVTWLPRDLSLPLHCYLERNPIKVLPENLSVESALVLQGTPIETLPSSLSARSIWIDKGGPLDRYSDEEIQAMSAGLTGASIYRITPRP